MLKSFFNKVKNLIIRQDFKDYDLEYDSNLIQFFLSDGYEKLKNRYALFNTLLSENNVTMNIMSDLQERVNSQLITLPYFKDQVSIFLDRFLAMVSALINMSPNKYDWLLPIAEDIKKGIDKKLETESLESMQRLYYLNQVSAVMAGELGAKASNLGELKNILNFPTPKGLIFSFRAYEELVAYNKIDELILALTPDLTMEDGRKIQKASSKIQKAILGAEIPPSLEKEFTKSLKYLEGIQFFAVRSSAMGEDGKYSFAGQFRSVLNVTRDNILEAFKNVCASLFEERAIHYRLAQGITEERGVAMAVMVIEMIPAITSGILYTLDPDHPGSNQMVITAVRGLGQYAVDGTTSPDIYILDREKGGKLHKQTIGQKHVKLVCDTQNGGVKEEPVPVA
ncbi:PEP/pyruvate-binding domain-containing protein, partial [Thermodesulfobacteriota bacterium]